jgi:hypothetical protein
MDKEKEKEKAGLSPSAHEAIANAAKANVDAAIKVASSAATAFVGALVKPRAVRRSRRSSKKKAASESKKKAPPASKPGKSKRPAKKASASASSPREATKKTAGKKPARKTVQALRRVPTKARRSSSRTSRQGSKKPSH